MKGKKYNAAEKHFIKKQEQYESKIKYLKEEVKSLSHDTAYYKGMYELALKQKDELQVAIDKLLEYTKLPIEDIKAACEKDIKVAESFKILSLFSNFRY